MRRGSLPTADAVGRRSYATFNHHLDATVNAPRYRIPLASYSLFLLPLYRRALPQTGQRPQRI